jgi:hypothetical protein
MGQKGEGRFLKLCVLKEHVFSQKNMAELDPHLIHNNTEKKRVRLIFHHQKKAKKKGTTVFQHAMNEWLIQCTGTTSVI